MRIGHNNPAYKAIQELADTEGDETEVQGAVLRAFGQIAAPGTKEFKATASFHDMARVKFAGEKEARAELEESIKVIGAAMDKAMSVAKGSGVAKETYKLLKGKYRELKKQQRAPSALIDDGYRDLAVKVTWSFAGGVDSYRGKEDLAAKDLSVLINNQYQLQWKDDPRMQSGFGGDVGNRRSHQTVTIGDGAPISLEGTLNEVVFEQHKEAVIDQLIDFSQDKELAFALQYLLTSNGFVDPVALKYLAKNQDLGAVKSVAVETSFTRRDDGAIEVKIVNDAQQKVVVGEDEDGAPHYEMVDVRFTMEFAVKKTAGDPPFQVVDYHLPKMEVI